MPGVAEAKTASVEDERLKKIQKKKDKRQRKKENKKAVRLPGFSFLFYSLRSNFLYYLQLATPEDETKKKAVDVEDVDMSSSSSSSSSSSEAAPAEEIVYVQPKDSVRFYFLFAYCREESNTIFKFKKQTECSPS